MFFLDQKNGQCLEWWSLEFVLAIFMVSPPLFYRAYAWSKVHPKKVTNLQSPFSWRVFCLCFIVSRKRMFLAIRNRVWMDSSTVLYKQRKEADCCCLWWKPKCVLHRHYSFLRLHFQPTFFEGQNHDKWLGTVVSVSPNYRGKNGQSLGEIPHTLGFSLPKVGKPSCLPA